jgi:hypothetical protein
MLNFLIISQVWPLFRVISILHTNLQIDKKPRSSNASSLYERARSCWLLENLCLSI